MLVCPRNVVNASPSRRYRTDAGGNAKKYHLLSYFKVLGQRVVESLDGDLRDSRGSDDLVGPDWLDRDAGEDHGRTLPRSLVLEERALPG
jgi:hypothetical protein